MSVFGFFGNYFFIFWLVLIGGLFLYFYRKGSSWARGRNFALLFYGFSLVVVLQWATRVGEVVRAPIPVAVLFVLVYGMGYYYIWKKGDY